VAQNPLTPALIHRIGGSGQKDESKVVDAKTPLLNEAEDADAKIVLSNISGDSVTVPSAFALPG